MSDVIADLAPGTHVDLSATSQPHATPTPKQALLITAAVIPVLAGYAGLAYALGVTSLFAGFLFLMYWSAIKELALPEFAPTLAGCLGGASLGWLLYALRDPLGGAAVVLPLVLVLAAIWAMVGGWAKVLVNPAFMVMLTVAAIPDLGGHKMFLGMELSILLSAAYFGALVVAGSALSRRAARKGGVAAVPA